MSRLFDHDTYLQNEEEPNLNTIYTPYHRDTCKDCNYCEARRTGKFTSVFYCNAKNRFVSPNSVKKCFKSI